MSANLEPLVALLRSEGCPLTSKTIQRRLALSQATVSRLISSARGRIIRIKSGRSAQYAILEHLYGDRSEVPIFAVEPSEVVGQVATLRKLHDGNYWVDGDRRHFWLQGESGSGLFNSLPYFIYDLRPAGFLGRQIARGLEAKWSVPNDPREWSDAQILRYLIEVADDVPGNLIFGEESAICFRQSTLNVINDRSHAYPQLAAMAMSRGFPRSSAAGEHPKFLAYHRSKGHLLVKFSPDVRSTSKNRWADLLRAEHHALSVLRKLRMDAVETALFSYGTRTYLESKRFDRHGKFGRSPAISLGMIDAEFVGDGHGWGKIGKRLHQEGLLDPSCLKKLCWLELFGVWIGNSDMHLGNIALEPKQDRFVLLPVYDMLPMAFAPVRDELVPVDLRPPIRTTENEEAWYSAGKAALSFWRRCADDRDMSNDFRRIGASYAKLWSTLLG